MKGACVELVCRDAGPRMTMEIRPYALREAKAHEVVVKVLATAVNPIDLKRSSGYGRRLLSLAGVNGVEAVLGNDFSGLVVATGAQVKKIAKGDMIFGVLPMGRLGGTHRTTLVVRSDLVRRLPQALNVHDAAVLPYTFCTLWRALQGVGLNEHTSKHRRVLVCGGSGALGQLAIQVLSFWGAHVTAIGSERSLRRCLTLGAEAVLDRHAYPLTTLQGIFDATLNFGNWDDESALIRCLKPKALGHATTVHPLMAELDAHGWVRGGARCASQWIRQRNLARSIASDAEYVWAIFRADPQALDVLVDLLNVGQLQLPASKPIPFHQIGRAFEQSNCGGAPRPVLAPHL